MKSVLISIRPEWVEKMLNDKKTIEVRKSAPKEVPFKCYIYMTQGTYKNLGLYSEDIYQNRMKVIGEFICDKVIKTCGWHISNLKIYDKPKRLNEFYRICKNPCKPSNGKILCLTTKSLKMNGCDGKIPLTRPPQSWQYVEELGNE